MPPNEPCMFQKAHGPIAARAGHISARPPTVPPPPADPHAPLEHVQLHLAMPDRSCTKAKVGGDGCCVGGRLKAVQQKARKYDRYCPACLGMPNVACGPYSFIRLEIAKET